MKPQYFASILARIFVHIFSLVTLVMTQSTSAHANGPPYVVYRLSYLRPTDVFDRGFLTVGNDADLLRYASGASIEDRTSAYSGALGSWDIMLRAARRLLTRFPGQALYLYAIRPTENFYNVRFSLRYARDHLPNPEAREQAASLLLVTPQSHEWAIRGNIPAEQIGRSRRVYLNEGAISFGTVIDNPHYVYLPSVTNPSPMPIHNATVEAANVAEEVSTVFFLPDSINNMGCQESSQRRKASPLDYCLPASKLSFKSLRTNFIRRSIAVGILPGAS